VSAVLALILSLTMSPEAALAKQQPVLFGSGQSTFLVVGPAGPGDVLRLARVKVTHLELPESRSFDDAEYRFVPASPIPASTRTGQQLTGTLWRFGAESPEGRKLSDGVRVEFEREDRVAPVMARGLAYQALGTADRLYLVHAGTKFAQILRRRARWRSHPTASPCAWTVPRRRRPPGCSPASTRRWSSARGGRCGSRRSPRSGSPRAERTSLLSSRS